MIVLSWNCRGLGNLRAVPSLRDLVRANKRDVLFLSETLVQATKIEELRVRLGFDCGFSVDRQGRGGGLAVLWTKSVNCSIQSYSPNFINIEVENSVRRAWRLTLFYGFPQAAQRRQSWELLRQLVPRGGMPWCIIGDFNDILEVCEKKGNHDRPNWMINGF